MALWITADTHFGHANIIRHCRRPFETVEEMNDVMIKNINDRVKSSDRLYVLGDFAFRGAKPKEYLDRLNCKQVVLIRGNHDTKDIEGFYGVHDYLRIKAHGHKIILFHYPMLSWDCSFHGSISFFGHVHGNLNNDPLVKSRNMLDVGVDSHDFKPLKLVDAIEMAQNR